MIFAWSVMNCVLEDAGRKKFVCKARSVRTCTSLLPDSILPIYTQFLNHADTICFYQKFHVTSVLGIHGVELGTEDGTHYVQAVFAVGRNETGSVKEHLSLDRSSESKEKQDLVLAKQNSLSKQSEEIKEQGDVILQVVSDTRSEFQSYYVPSLVSLNGRRTSVFPFPRWEKTCSTPCTTSLRFSLGQNRNWNEDTDSPASSPFSSVTHGS